MLPCPKRWSSVRVVRVYETIIQLEGQVSLSEYFVGLALKKRIAVASPRVSGTSCGLYSRELFHPSDHLTRGWLDARSKLCSILTGEQTLDCVQSVSAS